MQGKGWVTKPIDPLCREATLHEQEVQNPELRVVDPLPHARRDYGGDEPGDQYQGAYETTRRKNLL